MTHRLVAWFTDSLYRYPDPKPTLKITFRMNTKAFHESLLRYRDALREYVSDLEAASNDAIFDNEGLPLHGTFGATPRAVTRADLDELMVGDDS